MASFTITSYTASSVTIYASGLTIGNTIRFFVRLTSNTSDSTIDQSYTATATSMTKTFSGLQASTSYTANVHDGASWIGAKTFTTEAETSAGSFEIRSYTSTSVTIRVTSITSGSTIRFLIRKSTSTTAIIDEEYTATSTTMTKTFSGLSGGTTYVVNVHDGTSWLGAETFTTDAARPWDWAWYSTITQGGVIGLSALEWNTFCERINEFRAYDGLSDYNFTYVYKGDVISASIVNEARTAIASISGHGTLPSPATSGGAITAAFFNDLKDALNDIP